MKRVLALALALVLTLGVSVLAFADEQALSIGGKKYGDNWYYAAPGSTTTIVMDIWEDSNVADGQYYYPAVTGSPERWDTEELVLGAINVGQAQDDGYLKITAKGIKGAEYFKAFEFKKNTIKQLYLDVKVHELYIHAVPEIAFEVKVTFTKPTKIAEALALAAAGEKNGYVLTATQANMAVVTAPGAGTTLLTDSYFGVAVASVVSGKYKITTPAAGASLKNNDYILTKTENWKYGWNAQLEIGKASPNVKEGTNGSDDITYVIADAPLKSVDQVLKPVTSTWTAADNAAAQEEVRFMHIKKGVGEISTLEFSDTAYLEVKFADQPAINMYYSEAAIKAITNKYQDTEFQFFNWKAYPTFDFTADVELYVDEEEVGEEPVLYYFDGSTLTLVDATYEDNTFYFRTRQLGAYVAASKPLNITAPVETTAAAAAGTSAAATGNPHTGVSDFVGVAVALAVVSMAAAGAVALKK